MKLECTYCRVCYQGKLHAAIPAGSLIVIALSLVHLSRVATPKEFMKYVEAAQRRRDPEKRHQTSAVFVIDVTQVRSRSSEAQQGLADPVVLTVQSAQADYYEGWGLHGRFVLLESAIMDCLAEERCEWGQ